MNSDRSDRLGAFPLAGPVTYVANDVTAARRLLTGEYLPVVPWFHATTEEAAISAAWQGLAPGCWYGGDCCCICGYDSLSEVPRHRGDWLLEIYSPARSGQLKAWWVPPTAIRGAWNLGVFYEAAELRDRGGPLLAAPAGCECNLAELTREQAALWRRLAVA